MVRIPRCWQRRPSDLIEVVGLPLAAGEALSLGDLFGGHLGGVDVAVPHRTACVMRVSRLKTM